MVTKKPKVVHELSPREEAALRRRFGAADDVEPPIDDATINKLAEAHAARVKPGSALEIAARFSESCLHGGTEPDIAMLTAFIRGSYPEMSDEEVDVAVRDMLAAALGSLRDTTRRGKEALSAFQEAFSNVIEKLFSDTNADIDRLRGVLKRGGQSPTLDSPTVRTQKDGSEVKRLTIYLPVDLARDLSVACARRGVSISRAIEEALRSLVPKAQPEQPKAEREAPSKQKSRPL